MPDSEQSTQFCRPGSPADVECQDCGQMMHTHMWTWTGDDQESGHIVCPSD